MAAPETLERRRQMYPDAEELPPVTAQKEGNFPEARTDHTFVRYKNRFYVYGGRDEVQIFKDIHEY